MQPFINTCIHACMHANIGKYMHPYIHSYMLTYIHTYIHTYIKLLLHILGTLISTNVKLMGVLYLKRGAGFRVHTETISIPRGIFQSSWQQIAQKLAGWTEANEMNCLAQGQISVSRPGIEPATY